MANRKVSSSRQLTKKSATKVEFDFVLKKLKKHYPYAHCALHFTNPFELLVATILSAQCTDERVNKVTPHLFEAYPDSFSMSEAPVEEIEEIIKSTGFFRNKARNIKMCAQELVEKYKGEVPQTLEELHALPGVGRKTANVVLGNAFGIASGVVVDTHVTRLSNRFGWVKMTDAVKIEMKLNKMCPQKDWIMLSHYLIAHGREICVARSPKCDICFLQEACPKRGV
nr:endonuclease III [Pseudobdellovibrio exovorus]